MFLLLLLNIKKTHAGLTCSSAMKLCWTVNSESRPKPFTLIMLKKQMEKVLWVNIHLWTLFICFPKRKVLNISAYFMHFQKSLHATSPFCNNNPVLKKNKEKWCSLSSLCSHQLYIVYPICSFTKWKYFLQPLNCQINYIFLANYHLATQKTT